MATSTSGRPTNQRAAVLVVRTHRIMSDELAEFDSSSKLNAQRAFLSMLKEEGRRAADAFLAKHGADVGERRSADIDVLLGEC